MSKLKTDIFNSNTSEFFINMKSIPEKNSDDRKAFVLEEKRKCKEGINVNGIYIPGNLYFHLNYYKLSKDIKDNTGKIVKEASLPDLRDNEWIIFNDYYKATKESKIYTLFGLRQAGKSEIETSLCLRELSLFKETEALALFASDKDKDTFVKKARYALTHGEKFIFIPNIDKDWSKEEIRFGFTKIDNSIDLRGTLYIYNTKEGKNIQAGSGKSPTFVLMDECGKAPFRSVYEAVEPSILSDFSEELRCSPIFTLTGGEAEKSKDAENLIKFPNPAKQSLFEYKDKLYGGRFLSGLYRKDCKVPMLMKDYLGTVTNTWLDDITIKVSDFTKAQEIITNEIEVASKSPDKKALILKRIFYPLTIDDVFLSESENPYPRELVEQQIKLLESNPIGTAVELYRDNSTKEVKHKLSSKLVNTQFPNPDWKLFQDAPIVIYDFPKYKDTYGLHFIGIDTYNDDEVSHSDSLGSIHVYRKEHADLTDDFRGCMVASYIGRPKSAKEFNEIALMLTEFYNGMVLYEHVTPSLLEYFDGKNKTHMLIDTYDLQKTININTKTLNKKGLKPTTANQKFLLNSELGYLTEELEDGYGIRRIYDLYLLRQYLVDRDKNTDAIISNQHAIAALNMFAKMNVKIDDGQEYEYNPIRNAFGFGMKSSSDTKKRNAFGI